VCEYLEGDAAGTLLLRLVEQKSEADKGKFLEEVYLHLGERSAGVRASYSAAADRRNQQAFQKQRKVKIEQLRGVIAEREAACGELRGRVTLIEMEIGGLNHLLEKLNAATPPGQEGNVDRPKPVNDPLPRPATADVARLNDQIACLQKELHDARAKPPVGDHSAPQPAGAREFMREQAERLVAVWNDQAGGDPAGRQSLETAMRTMRTLEQIGPEQTRVAFNARYHACPVPISTGAAATVTRSGWKLQEAEGREYVLLKATVTPGG
jgi:hypothetical protein